MRPSARLKVLTVCTGTILAVSVVFMTQAIFLELSETFAIDISSARFSFSTVSLAYSGTFLLLGPCVDRYNQAKTAMAGLLFLAIIVFLHPL